MRKQHRMNNIHMLDAEQKAALARFQQDFNKALPHITAVGAAAKRLHQEMVSAPYWQIADTQKPDDAPEQQMWSVGHAKVNYVDHIEHEGTQDE